MQECASSQRDISWAVARCDRNRHERFTRLDSHAVQFTLSENGRILQKDRENPSSAICHLPVKCLESWSAAHKRLHGLNVDPCSSQSVQSGVRGMKSCCTYLVIAVCMVTLLSCIHWCWQSDLR